VSEAHHQPEMSEIHVNKSETGECQKSDIISHTSKITDPQSVLYGTECAVPNSDAAGVAAASAVDAGAADEAAAGGGEAVERGASQSKAAGKGACVAALPAVTACADGGGPAAPAADGACAAACPAAPGAGADADVSGKEVGDV